MINGICKTFVKRNKLEILKEYLFIVIQLLFFQHQSIYQVLCVLIMLIDEEKEQVPIMHLKVLKLILLILFSF